MSKFVDERVVEMSFDNKRFESNVKTSMGTIDKLKDSLDFSGTSKNINKHLNDIDTSSLTTGIGGIGKGFSALEIMGISVLANLTTRLVDFGIEIVKTVSGIDQLSSGWAKFQDVAISEATLLAQGYEQNVVADSIEDLLWFTDETSYSFTEMMNNMSKFTAAGIALDDAKNAMMGIANWAALSGQNAGVASRVMYQLSQAMGSGVIKLQDWKSIETANMATKEFKDEILKTAVAMGTLVQNVDGTYETLTGKTFEGTQFRDFLSEGFLTSDVLTITLEKYSSVANEVQKMMEDDSSLRTASKALAKYEKQIDLLEASITDLMTAEEKAAIQRQVDDARFGINAFRAAQEARTLTDAINAIKDAVSTGWTRIFREIFGGVEEAKKLWTDLANGLYDIFMDGMWKKIEILEVWSELGGRDDLWANTEETTGAFWNLFNAIKSIKDLIGGAWKNVFGFSDLDDYDKEVEDIGNKLKNLTTQLKDWSSGVSKFFRDPTEEMNKLVIDSAISMGELVANIDGTYTDLEGNILETNDAVEKLKTNLNVMKRISLVNGREVNELEKRKQTLETFTNILKGLFSILKIVGKTVIAVAKGFSPIIEVLKQALGYLLGALGIVGKEITQFAESTTMFDAITSNMQNFFNIIINFVKSLGLLKGVRIFIDSFRKSLSKTMGTTNNYAKAGGLFKSIIDSIAKAFLWLGDILTKYVVPVLPRVFELLGSGFGWLIGSISNLFSWFGKIIKRFREWASTSERFQNGIKFMKDVLTSLGKVFKKVWVNITGFFDSFGKVNMKPVDEFSEDVEEKFGPLKTFFDGLSNLLKGLWGVAKLIIPALGALFTFLGKVLTTISDKIKAVFTNDAGKIDFKKIFTVGFWAVVVVGIYRFADMLRSITSVFRDAFDSVFDYFNSKAMLQYMEAIKTMAISILLMVGALLILGMMDTGALIKSMTAMGFLIGFMVGVMLLMKNLLNVTTTAGSKGLFKAKDYMETRFAIAELGMAFFAMGLAILLLATSLKMISSLDIGQLLVGLGTVALLMYMLTKVTKAVSNEDKETNKAVKSMVKMAISISLLVIPLNRIGSIDVTTGIKGVIGIGILMGLLTAYSRYAKPIDKSQKSIQGLVSTAISLMLLTIPLKIIGGMEWTELGKAGAAILGFFIIISGFSKVLKESDVLKLQSLSWSLITIAISLTLFGRSMSELGSVNFWHVAQSLLILFLVLKILATINQKLSKNLTKARMENMTRMMWSLIPLSLGMTALGLALRVLGSVNFWSAAQALATLAIVLLVLVGINKILSKDLTKPRMKNMSRMMWSLIPLSLGLVAFGLAIRSISSIPWIKILSALGALSLIMLTLIGLTKILSLAKVNTLSLLGISASLIVLSIGLLFFSTAILALGSIPITKLAIGLAAIAASLIVLALVALVLKPLIITLLLLSLAVITFAVGVFLLVTAFTSLVAIIGVSSVALAAGLIAMAGAIVVAMPMILKALWVVLSGLLELFKDLVLKLLEVIREILPELGKTLLVILEELAVLILAIAPTLINALLRVVNMMLDGLIEHAPGIVNKLTTLIITILNAVGYELKTRAPEISEALIGFLISVRESIITFLETIRDKFIQFGEDAINGIIEGITNLWSKIKNKAEELANAIPKWIKNAFGIGSSSNVFKNIGGDIINGLISGITGLWDGIKKEVDKLANKLPDWMKKTLGIKSPSKVFAEIGEFIDMGLVKGIDGNSGDVYDSVSGLADEAVDGARDSGLSGVLNNLVETLNSDFDNEVVIKPVLDLSEIQNGKNKLHDIMSGVNSYDLTGSNSIASTTRDEINKELRRANNKIGDSTNQGTPSSEVINNTFNITGSNPKEIADEVSRVLQINIDRRRAKNGLVKV